MASTQSPGPAPELPPPPSPSADAGLAPTPAETSDDQAIIPDVDKIDIFLLQPVAALKILCELLETLVTITGDVPPTPPVSRPLTPRIDVEQAKPDDNASEAEEKSQKRRSRQWAGDDGDVPNRARTPIGSPEACATEPTHIEIVEAECEPILSQHLIVARKFYSKKPPPISLEEYLLRLHKYCPMKTGVYLATSLYIHRLAVIERYVPVTPRNVHRLVLAGLRVAMKALEDRSYRHSRFAKVGGVTEAELGRLEVSFCFVTDFELRVTSEMLTEHVKTARDESFMNKGANNFKPSMSALQKRMKRPVIPSPEDAEG